MLCTVLSTVCKGVRFASGAKSSVEAKLNYSLFHCTVLCVWSRYFSACYFFPLSHFMPVLYVLRLILLFCTLFWLEWVRARENCTNWTTRVREWERNKTRHFSMEFWKIFPFQLLKRNANYMLGTEHEFGLSPSVFLARHTVMR